MTTQHKPYAGLDLSDSTLLPRDWESQVRAVAATCGFDTILTGEGSTSRETKPRRRMRVRVADGIAVKASLDWLWKLYAGRLLEFSSRWLGRQLYIANDLRSAVNINVLRGRGAQYEWHVDSNTVTGVLFVTTAGPGAGGSLVFAKPGAPRSIVRPRSATFICFDAREIPHRVAPLRGGDRISIPMNYYDSATEQPRPEDLDRDIYSQAT
jgi:2OG-Fe(II) oxygenase superfamily